jgi:hypothetical protein
MRPFGLRDLGTLWCLRGRGITLDMQRATLSTRWPLCAALSGLLSPGYLGSTLTYVCHAVDASENNVVPGIAQVLICPERQEWQVVHLAPWIESQELLGGVGWASVLSDLCKLAGQWGALRIRAGVPAGGPEEEAFRQAGFLAYSREEVYRLPGPRPGLEASGSLRPIAANDAWPLLQLMSQVVPSSVQHAEGMNVSGASVPLFARLGVNREQGFVLEQDGELGAYVGVSRSRQGAWARILLHPDARKQAAQVVQHAVMVASPAPALFCAVRDYQAGLRSLLAGMGFDFVGVQVWLVKHATRPAICLRRRHLAALEKRTERATTPLHPVNDIHLAPCSSMTREHWMYEYRRADRYAVSSD